MKNYIISSSMGGLGGRLKSLVSAIKTSEINNSDLLLYWPKNPPCNCNFSDLFENNIKEITKEDFRRIIKQENIQILNKSEKIKFKKRFILIGDIGFTGFSKKDLSFKFEGIPINVRKDIYDLLNRLKIKEDILKKVNIFLSKFFKKEVIGVHIRKGDFKIIANNVGNVSSDRQFIEEMKREIKLNSKVKFFLATEDKETEEKFMEIFKDKIISYPKKTKVREEEGSVKEALIELLLLSKCKKIFGNFSSTFTELAWFFGECKPEIEIVIDKKELEIFKLKERKKKSFLNNVKRIIYEAITPLNVRLLDKI
jgi:hypothetical protein